MNMDMNVSLSECDVLRLKYDELNITSLMLTWGCIFGNVLLCYMCTHVVNKHKRTSTYYKVLLEGVNKYYSIGLDVNNMSDCFKRVSSLIESCSNETESESDSGSESESMTEAEVRRRHTINNYTNEIEYAFDREYRDYKLDTRSPNHKYDWKLE